MIRGRLACLTKEQMDLYRKACISPTAVSVNEVADAMQLYRYWLGYFEDPTDNFCVFDDVADIKNVVENSSRYNHRFEKYFVRSSIRLILKNT